MKRHSVAWFPTLFSLPRESTKLWEFSVITLNLEKAHTQWISLSVSSLYGGVMETWNEKKGVKGWLHGIEDSRAAHCDKETHEVLGYLQDSCQLIWNPLVDYKDCPWYLPPTPSQFGEMNADNRDIPQNLRRQSPGNIIKAAQGMSYLSPRFLPPLATPSHFRKVDRSRQ